MIKNLAVFVAKGSFRAGIGGVHLTPDCIVATDAYKLIELKTPTGVAEPVTVKMPKGLKTFDLITFQDKMPCFMNKGACYTGEVLNEVYPSYEKIVPKIEDAKVSITVTAEYLAQLAEAFKAQGKNGQVTLHVYDELKAILFSEESGKLTGLLMPIMKGR